MIVKSSIQPFKRSPKKKKKHALCIKPDDILKKNTKPPLLYTEASLLSAMDNAGRHIDYKKERSALKDVGIITPATRASIIETLFARSYILGDREPLVLTDKGLQVYEFAKRF